MCVLDVQMIITVIIVPNSSTKDDVFYEDVVLFIAIMVLFDMNSSDLVKCLA